MLLEHQFSDGVHPRLNLFGDTEVAAKHVILLHGLGTSWRACELLVTSVPREWSSWCVDLRGHGMSEHANRAYRLVDYAADVVRLIDSLGPSSRIVLVGHSLGGAVAVVAASRRLERVEAIVLGDTPLDAATLYGGHYTSLVKKLLAIKASGARTSREILKCLEKLLVEGPVGVIAFADLPGMSAAMQRFVSRNLARLDGAVLDVFLDRATFLEGIDIPSFLEMVRCPVLLIQADTSLGALMSSSDVALARSLMPDVTHVQARRVGHLLQLQDPGAVSPALAHFLSSL